jgi:hypothetical protein
VAVEVGKEARPTGGDAGCLTDDGDQHETESLRAAP